MMQFLKFDNLNSSNLTEIQSIRLSQLTSQINQALNSVFSNKYFWIIAEITNHTYFPEYSRHFFDLVEKSEKSNEIVAKISGVAWSAGDLRIKEFERTTGQKFKNDIQTLIKVSVDYHSSHGLKLTLHDIDINFTIGALERQKRETIERLLRECSDFIRKVGDRFITTNNQLQLPYVIQRIAVVTSSSSAALHDFTHTLESNAFGYKFLVDNYFTLVQGESNAEIVYRKILEVFNSKRTYDAVVIMRGGGAQTDFWIFDQFNLGKIVAKFPIPIITGIGHQKNETIVDMMANTPTKTPTKAAEFIIAHNRGFEENVLDLQNAIVIKTQQTLSKNSQLLSSLNSSIINNSRRLLWHHKEQLVQCNQITINKSKELIFNKKSSLLNVMSQVTTKPKILISKKINGLSNIVGNLKTFNAQYLKNQKVNLDHISTYINGMAPINILKKGFAIVKINNNIVSNPKKIKIGKDISVILSGKEIKSTVKSKTDYDERDFNI